MGRKIIKKQCKGCGECCSTYLPLLESEFNYMMMKAKELNLKPHKNRLSCPFLDDKKECMIYDSRPRICRLFHCKYPEKKIDKEMYKCGFYDLNGALFGEMLCRK